MKEIHINIKKEDVNDFIQLLWMNFESMYGQMGCQQSYFNSQDRENYIYDIKWCTDTTPFSAEIEIHNHTNYGIKKILLKVLDKNTNKHSELHFNNLEEIINKTAKIDFASQKNERIFSINIYTTEPLKHDISFEKSDIAIIRDHECSIKNDEWHSIGENKFQTVINLDFETKYKSNLFFKLSYISKNELSSKIIDKITDILSILTLLSLKCFTIGDEVPTEYQAGDLNDLNIPRFNIDDANYLNHKITSFPANSDDIIKIILSNNKYRQSCRRFYEAYQMRGGYTYPVLFSNYKVGYLIQYELLAYIASIETLLENTPETKITECNKCGEKSEAKEYKITKHFNSFISKYSDDKYTQKLFKSVYDDRSKFVHTGMNLHNFGAIGNGPFTIYGKTTLKNVPDYYFYLPVDVHKILLRFYKNITKT